MEFYHYLSTMLTYPKLTLPIDANQSINANANLYITQWYHNEFLKNSI